MIKKYTILDLDNCISDDLHRRNSLTNERFSPANRWNAYHIQCCLDKFVWGIRTPIPENIIIFTGRPILYGTLTKYWLLKNKLPTDNVYMRPIGNFMPSPELKEYFLNIVLQDKNVEIKMAYDDRQDVLNMYNKCGIQTTLKRINDYENG